MNANMVCNELVCTYVRMTIEFVHNIIQYVLLNTTFLSGIFSCVTKEKVMLNPILPGFQMRVSVYI